MKKIFNYSEFLYESIMVEKIPSYEECVEICSQPNSTFYNTKTNIDGYDIILFNYRLATYTDFINPLPSKPEISGKELRGLCFVFNKDGSLFSRYLLLEKFFNLNQVPESMYSIVKDYKIKFVNNKEDGSIASFIKLPNGKIIGRSKMGFNNDQSIGINKIYKKNKDIFNFVNWCFDNDIIPIFEYVSALNRIVLRYEEEELILLRLRDNKSGKHIDIKDHLDKLGLIKIAPFRDDLLSLNLDSLVELIAKEVDKEGCVITAVNDKGKDFFFKIKTPWYQALHGVLTDDIYRENKIIQYILDDRIDDVLGQIPETQVEAHTRINKIISVVKRELHDKVNAYHNLYKVYLASDSIKSFALKYRRDPNFAAVMLMSKLPYLQSMTPEEISDTYTSYDRYEKSIENCDPNEIAKESIRNNTKRLAMAREWLSKKDPSIFFEEPDEEDIES